LVEPQGTPRQADVHSQISEIKLVIIDAAQPQARIIEHDDTKPEPALIN
jgi:hypothetical protein